MLTPKANMLQNERYVPEFLSNVHSKGKRTKKFQSGISLSGRSMVEMLGVLAIIGVLSVGGLAGFSKGMEKYKINKTIDQVTRVISNMQTVFINEPDYFDALGNNFYCGNEQAVEKLESLGIISNDMISSSPVTGGIDSGFSYIVNPFQGGIWIIPDQGNVFVLSYGGLPSHACLALATQDWSALGVRYLMINVDDSDPGGFTDVCDKPVGNGFDENNIVACSTGNPVPIPVPLESAQKACSDCPPGGCAILWGVKNR